MPALQLDVSLIHADRADARGVCQIAGPDHYMDDWFARAAEKTFVSCDELVDSDYFHDPAQARLVHWERAATTGVIAIPGGAHPSSCSPALRIRCAALQGVRSVSEGGERYPGLPR